MEGYIVFLCGVITGVLIMLIFKVASTATGQFLIDSSDDEKDVFRLNLDNLEDVYKKRTIELKIVRDADLSHE